METAGSPERYEELGDISYRKHNYQTAGDYYRSAVSRLMEHPSLQKGNRKQQIRIYRLEGKILRMEYHRIISKYGMPESCQPTELADILKRGVYAGAFSKENGILFTSINPSDDKIREENLPANLLQECVGDRHWRPYVDIAASFPECTVGYLDLFPIRESDQRKFEKIVPRELKVELLKTSVKAISKMAPALIIHTNKTSAFYWGTDTKHPWLGLRLIPIEITDKKLSGKGTLYRIAGRTGAPESICLDEADVRGLEGCYLFVTSFTRPRKETKEAFDQKRLNADDVHFLWEEFARNHVTRHLSIDYIPKEEVTAPESIRILEGRKETSPLL